MGTEPESVSVRFLNWDAMSIQISDVALLAKNRGKQKELICTEKKKKMSKKNGEIETVGVTDIFLIYDSSQSLALIMISVLWLSDILLYSKSPTYEHSSCELSQVRMELTLQTFVDTNKLQQ